MNEQPTATLTDLTTDGLTATTQRKASVTPTLATATHLQDVMEAALAGHWPGSPPPSLAAQQLREQIDTALADSPLAASARAAAAKIWKEEPVEARHTEEQVLGLIIREKPAGVDFLQWIGAASLAVQAVKLADFEQSTAHTKPPTRPVEQSLQDGLAQMFSLTAGVDG